MLTQCLWQAPHKLWAIIYPQAVELEKEKVWKNDRWTEKLYIYRLFHQSKVKKTEFIFIPMFIITARHVWMGAAEVMLLFFNTIFI